MWQALEQALCRSHPDVRLARCGPCHDIRSARLCLHRAADYAPSVAHALRRGAARSRSFRVVSDGGLSRVDRGGSCVQPFPFVTESCDRQHRVVDGHVVTVVVDHIPVVNALDEAHSGARLWVGQDRIVFIGDHHGFEDAFRWKGTASHLGRLGSFRETSRRCPAEHPQLVADGRWHDERERRATSQRRPSAIVCGSSRDIGSRGGMSGIRSGPSGNM